MSHYALRFRKTGELVRHSLTSNDGADFSAEVSVCLSDSKYDPIWITNEEYMVKSALTATDDWWNAVRNPFKADDLEIVRVSVTVEGE